MDQCFENRFLREKVFLHNFLFLEGRLWILHAIT